MVDDGPILVTGAAGQLGSVGRTVTGLLLDRGFPVRAMVRREDERAASLRAAGAQVVVGDLLEPGDVLSRRQRLRPGVLRHVRVRRVPGGDRNHGGRGAGSRSERVGQHVPDDSLRDEHPEHHAEPSAAAALVERAECNSQKGKRRAEDFLRWLWREGRLSAGELSGRLRALARLAAGKLRPALREGAAAHNPRFLSQRDGGKCRQPGLQRAR